MNSVAGLIAFSMFREFFAKARLVALREGAISSTSNDMIDAETEGTRRHGPKNLRENDEGNPQGHAAGMESTARPGIHRGESVEVVR